MAEHFFFKSRKLCDSFYCGRVEDIALNMAGYYLGNKLYHLRRKH
jgi:hypothetical protein